MAGSSTDFLEQKLGDHIFRSATYAKPTQLLVGLFTTMPADDGTGGVEPVGNNYARVRHDPGDSNWYRSQDGLNRYWNALPVEFPVQSGPWGEVVGYGVWDQNGNLLIPALLDTPRTIDMSTANPIFPPGYLVLTFD